MVPSASAVMMASVAVWATDRKRSSDSRRAASARVRSMTRPSCRPTLSITVSSGRSGSTDSGLKNSSTACTSRPTRTGKAKAARTPMSRAV
jgi:hypothetical protein